MEFIFSRDIQAELLDVDKLFNKSLSSWWDEIDVFAQELDRDLSRRLLPAIIIKAYRCLGMDKEFYIKMTSLYKIMDFANKIHLTVKDGKEGQENNQQLQFTILIGDYIFGKVFSLLLETRAEKLLPGFAAMICEINEGFIVQYKLNGALQEVLARTRAPLYKNAFASAADLSGLSPDITSIYEDFGYNLGMALELIYVYEQKQLAGGYYSNAKEQLQGMNQYIDALNPEFAGLIEEIGREIGGEI
ncbi:MAG: hypothetical protein PHF24_05485 [Syntrophomonas sp.]|nr:hypothetical protein [Syntrophomonas sp.]